MNKNETFMEISPADFFYRNRDLAGFNNPTRALYSAFRELLENSLDACELHGILPKIYRSISRRVYVGAGKFAAGSQSLGRNGLLC